jgi:hypothetical protein
MGQMPDNSESRLPFGTASWDVEVESDLCSRAIDLDGSVQAVSRLATLRGTVTTTVGAGGSAFLEYRLNVAEPSKTPVAATPPLIVVQIAGALQSRQSVVAVLSLSNEEPIFMHGRVGGRSLFFENCSPALARALWRVHFQLPDENVPRVDVIVFRKLADGWTMTMYALLALEDAVCLQRSVFFHRERRTAAPKTRPRFEIPTAPPSPQQESSVEFDKPLTLEQIFRVVDRALDERRSLRQEKQDEVANAESDLDWCIDDILDLEFELLGLAGLPYDKAKREVEQVRIETTLQAKYEERVDYERELEEARDDLEQAEEELGELEGDIDELYDLIEQKSEERGKQILAKWMGEHGAVPPPPRTDMVFGHPGLGRISEEARKILMTWWEFKTASREDQGPPDKTYLIVQMAKCCERVFSDAFAAKQSSVLQDPGVNSLLAGKVKGLQFTFPVVEQQHGIDEGKLGKVLAELKKPAPQWSGAFRCGVAIYLLGRTYTVAASTPIRIENPLKCKGSDGEIDALRAALYELADIRNGFTHRDVASWNDVDEMSERFERCMVGLLNAFYC